MGKVDHRQAFELAEVQRRLANLIMIGTIVEVDTAEVRATVQIGELLTGFLPWLAPRAARMNGWLPPLPGEQVIVISHNGDPAQGLIIGSLHSDANPAPSDDPELYRILFEDGSYVEYHTGNKLMRLFSSGDIEAEAVGNIKAKAGVNIEAEAGANIKAAAGGDVTVDAGGSIAATAGSDITADAGGKIAATAGGDITAEAGANIKAVAAGDISAEAAGKIEAQAGGDIEAVTAAALKATAAVSADVIAPAINLNGAVTITGSLSVTGQTTLQNTTVKGVTLQSPNSLF